MKLLWSQHITTFRDFLIIMAKLSPIIAILSQPKCWKFVIFSKKWIFFTFLCSCVIQRKKNQHYERCWRLQLILFIMKGNLSRGSLIFVTLHHLSFWCFSNLIFLSYFPCFAFLDFHYFEDTTNQFRSATVCRLSTRVPYTSPVPPGR